MWDEVPLGHLPQYDELYSKYIRDELLGAFRSKKYDHFKQILGDRFLDINSYFEHPENGTLLQIACRSRGNNKYVESLLSHGARINENNPRCNGKAAIHEAVLYSDASTLQTLLKRHDCQVNITDSQGNTALHYAVECSNIPMIKVLLENSSVDINSRNLKDQTPLHLAASDLRRNENKYEHYAKGLLEFDAVFTRSNTPIINILLQRLDIDLDDREDNQGYTSRQLLAKNYPKLVPKHAHQSACKILQFAKKKKMYNFLKALKKGHVNGGHIDVNYYYPYPDNGTLLDIMCRSPGNVIFVESLLQYGAQINYANPRNNGRAPIHVATLNADEATLFRLRNHISCDVNVLDDLGNSALHYAAQKGNAKFIEILLRSLLDPAQKRHLIADVNIINHKNQTPLHLALSSDHKRYELAIKRLLEHPQIDLDQHADLDDHTCRQLLKKRNPRMLKMVPCKVTRNHCNPSLFSLLHKFDITSFLQRIETVTINATECNGKYTYLQYACYYDIHDVVDALLHRQIDPNPYCRNTPSTPSMICAQLGHHVLLQKLLNYPKTSFKPIVGQTLLHAVLHGMLYTENAAKSTNNTLNLHKCLQHILQQVKLGKVNINHPDHDGNTALHLAAKLDDSGIIKDLMSCGANIFQTNNLSETPLHVISAGVLEVYLDSCVTTNGIDCRYKEQPILFDYTMITSPTKQLYLQRCRVIDSPTEEPTNHTITSEVNRLLVLNDIPEIRRFLEHPVITSYLNIRWTEIKYWIYVGLILHTFAFFVPQNIYIFYFFYNESDCKNMLPRNNCSAGLTRVLGASLEQSTCFIYNRIYYYSECRGGFSTAILIWLLLGTAISSYRSIRKFFHSPSMYFKSLRNYLRVIMLTSTVAFLYFQSDPESRSTFASVALLSSWIRFTGTIGCHPYFSVNIAMFKRVSLNYFKFLTLYFILIVSYALSFNIAFHDKPSQSNQTNIFRNPQLAIFKTFIMLTGEYNADGIPFDDTFGTSHLIFMLFVFFIAIVLFNLLSGLAVGDTQAIRADAQVLAIVSRIKSITQYEMDFYKTILESISCQKDKLEKYQKYSFFPRTLHNHSNVTPLVACNPAVSYSSRNHYVHQTTHILYTINSSIVKEALKVLEKKLSSKNAPVADHRFVEYHQQLHGIKQELQSLKKILVELKLYKQNKA